jgi:hypothetical protein
VLGALSIDTDVQDGWAAVMTRGVGEFERLI